MQMAQDGAGDAMLVRPLIGFLVQELSLCGEPVLRPHLLIVDQRALARAVKPVLERGEGDGGGIGHGNELRG